MSQKNHLKIYLFGTLLLLSQTSLIRKAAAEGPNVENGKTLYDSKCAKCHGKSGGGDGKSAKALNTKPTAFDDGKAFEDKKDLALAPEERMAKAIKEGGPAVKESKEMDAYPNFSDQEIKDLIAYMKSFSKK